MAEALGEMGLHPWELYRYSMEEFLAKRKGRTAIEMIQWHQTRIIAYYAAAPHMKKGFKMMDIITLPGDKSRRKKPLSREEMLAIREKYKRVGAIK